MRGVQRNTILNFDSMSEIPSSSSSCLWRLALLQIAISKLTYISVQVCSQANSYNRKGRKAESAFNKRACRPRKSRVQPGEQGPPGSQPHPISSHREGERGEPSTGGSPHRPGTPKAKGESNNNITKLKKSSQLTHHARVRIEHELSIVKFIRRPTGESTCQVAEQPRSAL